MSSTVEIPLETARLVMLAFLPRNPNKMRAAHPDIKKAVVDFKSRVIAATSKCAATKGTET